MWCSASGLFLCWWCRFSLCCCCIVGSWVGWWSSFNPTGVRLAQMWPEVWDGVGNSFRGAITRWFVGCVLRLCRDADTLFVH